MSTLLLHIIGNPTLNRTVWPPQLYIFDDIMIYKKRNWFIVKEITISYNQISQVTMINGLLFASLDIITTGEEDIKIKFLPKKVTRQAKTIIDQKIYHSHAKHNPNQGVNEKTNTIVNFEKSINRLRELKEKGAISEYEYQNKKKQYLKKVN